MNAKPLERVVFEADALRRDHPPQWDHPHKLLVYDIARSSGDHIDGEINYARWSEEETPASLSEQCDFTVCEGVFDYTPSTTPASVLWHLNFADPYLFCAYGSSLMAQDELQVAEHPILGSLYEALISTGETPMTQDPDRRPTPVTITGVQRSCAIDTMPNPATGRQTSLYGNAFAGASREEVTAATTALSPATVSNILAMAALPGGWGAYSREQMTFILDTAYTGFSAAKRESKRLGSTESHTIINTGFWGCGAFGGNRRLMTILQAMAAELAGVDVVFWSTDDTGVLLAREAYASYRELATESPSVSRIIDLLLEEGFQWGVSDGN